MPTASTRAHFDNDSMSPASTNKPAAGEHCRRVNGGRRCFSQMDRGATVRILHIGQASEDVVMGFAAAAHSFQRDKKNSGGWKEKKTRASVGLSPVCTFATWAVLDSAATFAAVGVVRAGGHGSVCSLSLLQSGGRRCHVTSFRGTQK